ncbi:MAG: hypothetical protein SFW66_08965 [Gammaproteobacteria bacterium]|nr:hypothetical protein [Gammaproteobacteria bacterium]
MKIYIDMEPQPEIEWESELVKTRLLFYPEVNNLKSCAGHERQYFQAPYKTGDEIETIQIVSTGPDGYIKEEEKFIVKSCNPIQRDGRWKWEIEY